MKETIVLRMIETETIVEAQEETPSVEAQEMIQEAVYKIREVEAPEENRKIILMTKNEHWGCCVII
jgi:hypothetical protein